MSRGGLVVSTLISFSLIAPAANADETAHGRGNYIETKVSRPTEAPSSNGPKDYNTDLDEPVGDKPASNAPERIISPTLGCTFIPYEGTDADAAQSRPNAVVDESCFDDPDPAAPAAAPAQPQVTQAMVRRAFERVPVPELSSRTQPVDKTLVNFDTIFYVDAQPMTETVTLLGQQVTLFIEPSTYRWDHGDGSEVTTYSPGAAYPSKEIVHRYMKASRTVRHQVSIDWTATYSVNGGPAQPVPGTVTTVGPQTPLRISEAAPALSGAHSG